MSRGVLENCHDFASRSIKWWHAAKEIISIFNLNLVAGLKNKGLREVLNRGKVAEWSQ
jgi:hypothetical protein